MRSNYEFKALVLEKKEKYFIEQRKKRRALISTAAVVAVCIAIGWGVAPKLFQKTVEQDIYVKNESSFYTSSDETDTTALDEADLPEAGYESVGMKGATVVEKGNDVKAMCFTNGKKKTYSGEKAELVCDYFDSLIKGDQADKMDSEQLNTLLATLKDKEPTARITVNTGDGKEREYKIYGDTAVYVNFEESWYMIDSDSSAELEELLEIDLK